jgi:hypothetical protein
VIKHQIAHLSTKVDSSLKKPAVIKPQSVTQIEATNEGKSNRITAKNVSLEAETSLEIIWHPFTQKLKHQKKGIRIEIRTAV